MKYELTSEQLIELAEEISFYDMEMVEAKEHIIKAASDMQASDETEVVWPTDERIDAIGQNGNDGLHYNDVVKAGVYES